MIAFDRERQVLVYDEEEARMATHLVPVEEYLHSTFEPDAEYVEETIVCRAMPQSPHSDIQTFLAHRFYVIAIPFGYRPWVNSASKQE